jgi:hypothetical protein
LQDKKISFPFLLILDSAWLSKASGNIVFS